jgi:hypothetical protein
VLEVETRLIKGPRTLDGLLPTHKDNQTIVKERIYLDKANPNILHDEITMIDHAAATLVDDQEVRATKCPDDQVAGRSMREQRSVTVGKKIILVGG